MKVTTVMYCTCVTVNSKVYFTQLHMFLYVSACGARPRSLLYTYSANFAIKQSQYSCTCSYYKYTRRCCIMLHAPCCPLASKAERLVTSITPVMVLPCQDDANVS